VLGQSLLLGSSWVLVFQLRRLLCWLGALGQQSCAQHH
jgi:hypothetical protein